MRPAIKTLPQDEALGFLQSIERGEVTMKPVGRTWDEAFAGNVEFVASNGWKLVVFNDCDDWDYIDAIEAPDGRVLEFEFLDPVTCNWMPSRKVALEQFGWKAPDYYVMPGEEKP